MCVSMSLAFFMWYSFPIRCVFHYQISENANWRESAAFLVDITSFCRSHFILFVWWYCGVCVCLPCVWVFGFFSFYFFTSRLCVKFGFYRFLFNIRIRLRRCNDGIMMIVAKMAKDLKCDNVCLPLSSLLHWLLFGDNCDVALITLQNQTYAHEVARSKRTHTQPYSQHGGQ